MKIIILDAKNLKEKEASHKYLKEVFDFPDYYGANLDALHDCLTELSDTKVFISNISEAGPYFLYLYPILMKDVNATIIR